MRKKLLLLAFTLFAASVYALDVTKIEKNDQNRNWWCRTAEGISIGIGTEPKELFHSRSPEKTERLFLMRANSSSSRTHEKSSPVSTEDTKWMSSAARC